jgi:hypothetical protein
MKSRSLVANAEKRRKKVPGPIADEAVKGARRALAEAKIASYVAKVVAAAPPLTAEQRDRLATLLSGGAR